MSSRAPLFLLLWVVFAGSAVWAERVVDQDRGFSLNVPSNWMVVAPQEEAAMASLQTRSETPPYGFFVVQRFDRGGRTLEAYGYQQRFHIVARMGGRLLTDEPLKLDGMPGWKFIYTGTDRGKPKKFFRVLLVHGDHLYVLHGTSEPNGFERDYRDYRQMARSFRAFTPGVVPLPAPGD